MPSAAQVRLVPTSSISLCDEKSMLRTESDETGKRYYALHVVIIGSIRDIQLHRETFIVIFTEHRLQFKKTKFYLHNTLIAATSVSVLLGFNVPISHVMFLPCIPECTDTL